MQVYLVRGKYNIDNLYDWNVQSIESERLLISDRVISHRDLDPKNVMWSYDDPIIIDWEAAGYKKKYGELQANWSMILANEFIGKFGWLEYSLKRSLWIECNDEEEQRIGTAQVTGTINAIRRYVGMISELEKWLISEV